MRNCNCSKTRKQDKDAIRELAIKSALANEEDIQIHTWTERGSGRLYDFEPKGFKDRGRGLVEIIKFRDYKSKDVLSDSKGNKPSGKGARKPKEPRGRGSRKKGIDFESKVPEVDELIGDIEPEKPTESVE